MPSEMGEADAVITYCPLTAPDKAELVSSDATISTLTRFAVYRLPKGVLLALTTKTNLPSASSRTALFGTTQSKVAFLLPKVKLTEVPAVVLRLQR